MDNNCKFTSSQIRYMIWLLRLSRDGFGVKNVELSKALGYSKPSVHNMLRAFAEMGIVTQESFKLAHFTNKGRDLARRYEVCFQTLRKKMNELLGDNVTTELSICAVLADMPREKIDELYEADKNTLL